MKTRNIIGAVIIGLFIMTSASAEYIEYNTQTDFENAKGAICEAATDGCNNFGLQDGKVMWGTEMFCQDHIEKWTCTKFKEGSITTMSLPVEDAVACTMEYAPVCGVDGKTYSNTCAAEKGAKVEVKHEGECGAKKQLSQNDESFYGTIQNRLNNRYQERVNVAVSNYTQKLEKLSYKNQEATNTRIIALVENEISKFLMKYPQDIALPEAANNRYLTLSLLKFELMKLNF